VGVLSPRNTNVKQIVIACAAVIVAPFLYADELPQYVLEDVVVTATRFEQPYRDKPVNMTVISQSDIKHSAAKTLPELLGAQPGINTRNFFGTNGTSATVDIRGFGATGGQNTLVLLDGKRINDIDLSGVQWPAIPIAAVERIEILRGGGAVQYGDGASAGVINIITKTPRTPGSRVEVGATVGSYATGEAQINASYSSGRRGFNISASHYDSNSYRDNNHNRQSNVIGDFRWGVEKSDFSLKFGSDKQAIRLPGGRFVQPSIGLNEPETDRRGTSNPLDFATRDGYRMNIGWNKRFASGEINVDLGYRDKKQTAFFDFGGFPDFRLTNLDVWSFTPRLKLDHSSFGIENTLVVGIDWYKWDYRLRVSNSTFNIGQPINNVTASQENTAFYLHHSTQISKKTTASVGIRRERFRLDSQDSFDATAPGAGFGSAAPSATQIENEYAYEIGVRHQTSPSLAIIAKVGRSYRFANVDEIYEFSPAFSREFQLLCPQTAQNEELALEFSAVKLSTRASIFRTRVRDEIHLDAFSTGVGNTNLPPLRRDGLELEAKWLASQTFTLGGGYTYLRSRFIEGILPGSGFTALNIDLAGKTVPLVPRHKFNLSSAWKVWGETYVNLALSYVGEQFMENDEGNTLGVTIPAYTVADFKLTHNRGPWRFQASINNVFDRQYFDYAIRSQFVADRYSVFPLPERNATVALEYAFK
jgi:iron complex outermembrane recepter protein